MGVGVYLEILWNQPYVRAVTSVTLLLGVLLVLAGPRTTRARRAWWALTLVGVGVIVAVTTFGSGDIGDFGPRGGLSPHCVPAPGLSEVIVSARSAEGALNIALFVPVGLGLVMATRRAPVALGAAAVLSFAVEAYQSVTPMHSCTVADWLLNVLGTACGALIGLALLRVSENVGG